MLEALINDALTVILIIFVFGVIFALVMATLIEVRHILSGNQAKSYVDALFQKMKIPGENPLITWYEVRLYASGDKDLTPKQRRDAIEAVQARISECKIKNKAVAMRDGLNGKSIIIHN